MTLRTIQRSGSRYYVDTSKPDAPKAPGVTSVIGMLAKPFLAPWNAKLTAELAVDSIPFLQELVKRDRQGAIDYLKGAAWRYTKTRAGVGSEAHDLFERMIRGQDRLTEKNARGEFVMNVASDLIPYRAAFAEFLIAVNPELVRAEDVVWSYEHDYAGSFDAILIVWLDPVTGEPTPDRSGTPYVVIVDWKTGKDTHAEVALQLAAYKNADVIIGADGTTEPVPAIDGGFVLHVTADGWDFIPVVITDDVFAFFLALRQIFEWDRPKGLASRVLGASIAGVRSRFISGTQRRGKS